jgi:hypothetical protein
VQNALVNYAFGFYETPSKKWSEIKKGKKKKQKKSQMGVSQTPLEIFYG